MKDHLTPKQVARAIGVSESSLKRWCDQGQLIVTKTVGGHRRLPLHGVLQFLKEKEYRLVDPEAIGLPVTSGQTDRVIGRSAELLLNALREGASERVQQVIVDAFLADHALTDICDKLVAPAMVAVGEEWECGSLDVYEERRACQQLLESLQELRRALPLAPDSAPLAIGGTLEGDIYQIPTTMAELVLRDLGWRTQQLGCNIPAASLARSIHTLRPRLFWLSVSHIDDAERFLSDSTILYEAASHVGTALAVGGQAITDRLRRDMRKSCFCDNMQDLADYARSITS